MAPITWPQEASTLLDLLHRAPVVQKGKKKRFKNILGKALVEDIPNYLGKLAVNS